MLTNALVAENDIFTEYDDSLAGEIFRDPLGMQVIWSHFGQKIFGNRITSVGTHKTRTIVISLSNTIHACRGKTLNSVLLSTPISFFGNTIHLRLP